jgi:hypothetical protein
MEAARLGEDGGLQTTEEGVILESEGEWLNVPKHWVRDTQQVRRRFVVVELFG